MNWITNYVRPRINSIFSRRETPENLWQKCDECGSMLFHRELSDNLNVCTNCGHHMAISPRARFGALFDGGVFAEVAVPDLAGWHREVFEFAHLYLWQALIMLDVLVVWLLWMRWVARREFAGAA